MRFLPTKTTLRSWTNYLLLGGAVFAVGLIWNFPYEKVRFLLTHRLAQKTGYEFDMETLSPALPLGFVAKNATIVGPSLANFPINLEFDSLRVTISPLSPILYLFKKAVSASFHISRQQERWWGQFRYGRSSITGLELETKSTKLQKTIPLDDFSPLLTNQDLKLHTTLTLHTSFEGATPAIGNGDFSATQGDLSLTSTNTTLELPFVNTLQFDRISVEAKLEKGLLDIKSISLAGSQLSGKISGSLKIDPYFPRSQLDLEAALTVSENAQNLRTLVSTYGSVSGIVMDPNGKLTLKITGPVSPITELSVRSF